MFKFRSLVMVLGVSAALLIPFADAYGRGGGGRGGGGGGRGGGGGGGGRGGGGGGGMMQAPPENPALAGDRALVSKCSAELGAANNAYTTAETSFKADFMKQPEYADAQKAVDDDTKALDSARTAVINKLKASSAPYKTAVQKEADAKKKLDQIRATGGNRDAIAAQSKVILDAGTAVSKIEDDTLAKDAPYQAAKTKLAADTATLKTQKDALAEAIKNDDNLKTLKAAIDTAKTALADANTKLRADGG